MSNFIATCITNLNNLANDIEKVVTKEIDGVKTAWADAKEKRFRETFPQLPPGEILIGEFLGMCVSGPQTFTATLFISSSFLNFVVDVDIRQKVPVSVPLRSIRDVQRGNVVRGANQSVIIHPIRDVAEGGDAILIFTDDGKVHQFFNFFSYPKAFHTLLNAWKSCLSPSTAPPQATAPPVFTSPQTQPTPPVFTSPQMQPTPPIYPVLQQAANQPNPPPTANPVLPQTQGNVPPPVTSSRPATAPQPFQFVPQSQPNFQTTNSAPPQNPQTQVFPVFIPQTQPNQNPTAPQPQVYPNPAFASQPQPYTGGFAPQPVFGTSPTKN